jgi:hypothetical protein
LPNGIKLNQARQKRVIWFGQSSRLRGTSSVLTTIFQGNAGRIIVYGVRIVLDETYGLGLQYSKGVPFSQS